MTPDFTQPALFDVFSALQTAVERSSFLVSLAGIIDGYGVTFHRSQHESGTKIRGFQDEPLATTLYSVSSGPKRVFFNGTLSERVNYDALIVTKDKSRTKMLLAKAGIATPFGGLASAADMSILSALEKAGVTHVAVKPTLGTKKEGVVLNLSLADASAYIFANPKVTFIVDQMIKGHEIRAFVVGNEVVHATAFVPQHVIGDGVLSIQRLLDAERARRDLNPLYVNYPFDWDEIHKSLRLRNDALGRVPDKGERVWLTTTPIAKDGDRVPVHHKLSEAIRQTCVKTAKLLGCDCCGLDVMVTARGETYIIEANARPGIAYHSFPHPTGEWNLDVPRALLRHQFPRHELRQRLVTGYDFAGLRAELMRTDRTSKGVDAADFVTFAEAE